jgi:valyl-tRNA synthetase
MELPTVYNPEETERPWYSRWEAGRLFASQPDPARRPFAIVIPPPNVTGSLHMGHALNSTLQDLLIRWRRMKGDNTLWVPGTDHGGIATQNVVEKLLKKEGKSRHDLGREAFLERMWAWRKESGDTILLQLRRLGCALDWSRARFTMDEESSRAVAAAFVEFHRRDWIYLGERLVNWCPRCATALSDIEVEHEDRAGKLWHIRYPFVNDPERGVTVATTRPETMLGDTAVAVHPKDERYAGLAGKHLRLPLMDRDIPLVADDAVDASFGTGAVKVTPSHDAADFEIGRRHNLPRERVIGFDGHMTPRAGRYAGLSLKACRDQVVQDLETRGFLVKVEDYRHAVATCYRCATAIEPLESSQWFLKTGEMAQAAARATEEGRVRIHPESWAKPYLAWLHNNRDWCISRQIWWGHKIPVWYCLACGDYSDEKLRRIREDVEFKSEVTKSLLREFAKRPIVQAEAPAACPDCGRAELLQDPDVLDTWFSSGLWPLTTLGWPGDTADLRYYYPTSVLATGHEILYLWVARMVMMGLALKNEIPYTDVFIHGIVRDKQGRKMSKSLNNVIDPLDIMKKYGTDALRYSLAAAAAPGRDMQLSDDHFVGARNFANKIWNASRFALSHLDGFRPAPLALAERDLTDRWIRQRLADTLKEVDGLLAAFDMAQAARALYGFFRGDFCDWYIELAKRRLLGADAPEPARRAARQTLAEVLDGALRALHPVLPFLTDELWRAYRQATGQDETPGLLTASYFAVDPNETAAGEDDRRAMALLMAVTTTIRTIRAEMNVPPGKPVSVVINVAKASEFTKRVLSERKDDARHLARVGDWTLAESAAPPPQAASAVVADVELFIPLGGLIDFEKEKQRLTKDLAALDADLAHLTERLEKPDFISRAPADKVAEVRARMTESAAQRARLSHHLAALEN